MPVLAATAAAAATTAKAGGVKGNNEIENAPVLSAVEDVLGRVPEGGVVELLLPRPLRARDAAVEAKLGHGTGVVLRKRKVTKYYFNL